MKTNKNIYTKNIVISILFIIIVIILGASVSAKTLFSDTFNDNNLYNNGWIGSYFKTPSAPGDAWGTSNDMRVGTPDGTSYVFLNDHGAIYNLINTSNYKNITLYYSRRTGMMGPKEKLRSGWKTGAYSSNWNDWNELEEVNSINWSCVSFHLPADAENTEIRIAFFSDSSFWGYGYVDDVEISGDFVCIDNDNDSSCSATFAGDDYDDNNASIHYLVNKISDGIDKNNTNLIDNNVYRNLIKNLIWYLIAFIILLVGLFMINYFHRKNK